MKCLALLLLLFSVRPMMAKENWPLTVKVLSTKNIEDPHGSFHFAKVLDNASAAWSHRVAEHVFVEASDGNSYELVPQNAKDMLLPGTFSAKIEKRDMKVCEPKDNGNCRDVKFKIVAAVVTVNTKDAQPADPPVQTSISIDSIPSNADIEVDGVFVGNTPSTIPLTLGTHQVVVKRKGFNDWSRSVSIKGGTVHLNAELDAVTH